MLLVFVTVRPIGNRGFALRSEFVSLSSLHGMMRREVRHLCRQTAGPSGAARLAAVWLLAVPFPLAGGPVICYTRL